MIYPFLYTSLCSNPPVFCTWHLCPSWLATWHCIILAWGVSLTPLDSHVQVLELGACVQSNAAVAWIFSRPFGASSFQAPCESLEFSFLNSWVPFFYSYLYFSSYTCMWAPFCTIHILYIFCTLAFAHLWYNIIVILDHSGDNSVFVYMCWNV